MNGQPPNSHRSPQPPQPRQADAVWIAGFFAVAIIGGLAAAALTSESRWWALFVSLGVAVVVVLVFRGSALDQRQPALTGEPPAQRQPATAPSARDSSGRPAGRSTGWQSAVPDGPRDPGQPSSPARDRAVSDSHPYAWSWPLGGRGPEGEPTPGRPATVEPSPPRPGVVTVLQDPAHVRPQASDLAEFLGQVLIAQCPHCAAFRVDADTQTADWLFACCECGTQWTWRPGTPWPEVHARPAARRRLHRSV